MRGNPALLACDREGVFVNVQNVCCAVLSFCLACAPALAKPHASVQTWLTTPDRTSLLAEQHGKVKFADAHPGDPVITVDDTHTLQPIDGFGGALTDGSAQLMMGMVSYERKALLQEMFGHGKHDIGISYIRVSIGASDMSDHVYTLDDMPAGETDPDLKHFSLDENEKYLIPVLKEILKIRPDIKILASPWTAPSWMKTNDAPKGGSLKPEAYDVYAKYLVLYLQGMARQGVPIDAITMQNEPRNPKNTPSLVMTAPEQAAFLTKSFGPALRRAGLHTKLVIYDHNCDMPEYPLTVLADTQARQYVDGTGFHLYEGETSAMTKVHDAYPDKNVYFTEQLITDHPGATQLAIAKPVARVMIGATRNWSRNVLLWNLAADSHFGPHTGNGGCPVCEGAVTIEGNNVTRNLSYYTIAQASKFIPAGSVRVGSEASAAPETLASVAFRTPKGELVLLVANTAAAPQKFAIGYGGKYAEVNIPAGAAATYVW